jgi:hypothetical protein
MRPMLSFARAFPQLWRTTRHLHWPEKVGFWRQALKLYRTEYVDLRRWAERPPVGDPAFRPRCCDLRHGEYRNRAIADTDLAALVKEAGRGLGGHIRFFDCSVCGQAWMQDWEQQGQGGAHHVRKI